MNGVISADDVIFVSLKKKTLPLCQTLTHAGVAAERQTDQDKIMLTQYNAINMNKSD